MRQAGGTGGDRAVATVSGARRSARAHSSRRGVRHGPAHLRRHASVSRISASDRTRTVRRSGGDRPGLRPRGRSKGLCHPLSVLRRLRRLPARQDQLLSAHRRPRRSYRRRNGGLRLCAGAQCGRGRRRHARSGGDGRVPRDRRPRSAPRQSAQRRPRSRRRRRSDRRRLHDLREAARRLGHRAWT